MRKVSEMTFKYLQSQKPSESVQAEINAWINRMCAPQMKWLVEGPRYVLKTQLADIMSTSKSYGYERIKEMVEDKKILAEGKFRGVDFVYPTMRLMKWYDPENPVQVPADPSEKFLLENFMLVEYWIKHSWREYPVRQPDLLYQDYEYNINSVLLSHVLPDAISRYKTGQSIVDQANDFLNNLYRKGVYPTDLSQHYEDGDELFFFPFLMIFHKKTTLATLKQMLNKLSIFTGSFGKNTVYKVSVLVEDDESYEMAKNKIDHIMKKTPKGQLLGHEGIPRIYRTNIGRYWQGSEWYER